jgi:tRNA 2-thiouridine synthesizing protein A
MQDGVSIFVHAHIRRGGGWREGGAMAEVASPAQTLDCTGMNCPLPVIKTAQAVKTLAPGMLLELLATDPGVEPDMHAWASRTGNELVSITNDGGVFHVLIRRAT